MHNNSNPITVAFIIIVILLILVISAIIFFVVIPQPITAIPETSKFFYVVNDLK